MKKNLLVLAIALSAIGCGGESDSTTSPFTGDYSGSINLLSRASRGGYNDFDLAPLKVDAKGNLGGGIPVHGHDHLGNPSGHIGQDGTVNLTISFSDGSSDINITGKLAHVKEDRGGLGPHIEGEVTV